jgi:hypothetical protein
MQVIGRSNSGRLQVPAIRSKRIVCRCSTCQAFAGRVRVISLGVGQATYQVETPWCLRQDYPHSRMGCRFSYWVSQRSLIFEQMITATVEGGREQIRRSIAGCMPRAGYRDVQASITPAKLHPLLMHKDEATEKIRRDFLRIPSGFLLRQSLT